MSLSDVRLRNAKPKEKSYKIHDSKGLYIIITPKGGKWWRFDYLFQGKRKTISMGTYPEVPLKEARERRDEARKLLAQGIDPSAYRKRVKEETEQRVKNTFGNIAIEWMFKHQNHWAESHSKRIKQRLEKDVLPWLANRPISEITAPEILTIVRRVEARGAIETARRILQTIGQIFRYAVATGRAEIDPTYALKGAIPPPKVNHMPAPTDPKLVGQILRAFDAFQGSYVVYCAIKLLPLVFVRPGELRSMRWKDVSLDEAEWRFVMSKTENEHIVPLSRQACEILEGLYALTGRNSDGWVFPSLRSTARPISNMTINAAYRRLGIDTKRELTAHGWRAVARTLLHEQLGYPPEIIEHQLGHRVPDMLGNAYNRTKFIEQRKEMMQKWADYLDALKKST